MIEMHLNILLIEFSLSKSLVKNKTVSVLVNVKAIINNFRWLPMIIVEDKTCSADSVIINDRNS